MGSDDALGSEALKRKEGRQQGRLGDALALRVHRAISWIVAAERAAARDDVDLAFISHWVAFNAAYARQEDLNKPYSARTFFGGYFKAIVGLDAGQVVYDAIWRRFAGPVRIFLDNQFVFDPYWRHRHGDADFADWRERFDRQSTDVRRALGRGDTAGVLVGLFDRLYVLRNQLVHGGATWGGRVNRDQVRQGAEIMAFLVPHFIDLMMDHPDVPWGAPPYPVVEDAPR